MRPMLATSGDFVPRGEEWSHEVKWDGVRTIAEVGGDGRTRLWSRNENQTTIAWPEVAEGPVGARGPLRHTVVDGEIIALNERGLPDFRTLMERMHVRSARTAAALADRVPATYMVFDLLRLDGEDLTSLPLDVRRARLTDLGLGSVWQVPAAYDDGQMLFDATLGQGLEGIVSKRRTSRYAPGQRSLHWKKFAHRFRASYVVGGWRPQEGHPDRLGALLVGEMVDGELRYRGRVGSGIGPRASRLLAPRVAGLERPGSPFADEVPREDARGTTWLEPLLVADVETHGLGYDRLRQPSYQGLRDDLTPEEL